MATKGIGVKLTAMALCVSLLHAPYALALQGAKETERQETCRKLLESIGNSQETARLLASLKDTQDAQHIVDLTDADVNTFKAAAAEAKRDDILVINERNLADAQFTSGLESSAALFSIASANGGGSVNPILRSRAGQPEIVAAIPTDALGVQNVFGIPPSASGPAVEYLDDTAGQFRALKNSKVLNYALNGRSLAEVLVSKAKRDSRDPLVVVAHNDRGLLKLPDGSSIRIDALYQALGKRVGVVLSCDTIHAEAPPNNAVLTNRELDFRDVATGLASVENLLAANPSVSLASVLLVFSKSIPLRMSSSAETVKVVAMIVGGLIVIGLLYYWVCEDSATPPAYCPHPPKSGSSKSDKEAAK